MTMPQLWIPSDDLIQRDEIARQKILSAYSPPDLAAHGVKLPDVEDDDTNAAAASIVLAALDGDGVAGAEPGACDDDDEIDDPADREPVADDV